MKAILFQVALWSTVFIITWHVAFNAGQREMRQFQALCESPGVRCVVQFTPDALDQLESSRTLAHLPDMVDAEFADVRGRVDVGCIPGSYVEVAGAVLVCIGKRWELRQ